MALTLTRRASAAVVLAAVTVLSPAQAAAAACDPHGAIGEYWRSIGGDDSFLGPCRTDEQPVAGGVVQHFHSGSVYWSAATGPREVHGDIRATYDALGGPSSVLRLPTTHELRTPTRPGAYNHFQGGSVYWSPETGAHMVVGAIRARWEASDWEKGALGFPTSSERPTPRRPGAYSIFQGGSVYWSPDTGARIVRGSIREAWSATGWENGDLGFPLTDELGTPVKAGAYNHFQGGSVYWSPQTGAHVVRGAIRVAWEASGWENGPLGFPISSERPTPQRPGAYSNFQGGSVYWSPQTGAHLVHGAIRARWAELGWENSSLGFPTSSEYGIPGGRRSDFSGGSIVWDAGSGAVRVIFEPPRAFTSSVHAVSAADLPSSWRAGCPVPPQDLRLLRLSHLGFDGRSRTGEIVVHADQVDRVLRAFARLYQAGFPVARMERVDAFGGSDDASMEANNTSGFNCRRVAGSTAWSQHAYGRAIDVNPVQNPYVSGSTVSPPAGGAYLDRGDVRPGMVVDRDMALRAFTDQGWGWGGYFSSSKDYQHFSANGR